VLYTFRRTPSIATNAAIDKMLHLHHLTVVLAALLSLSITFCNAAVPSQAFKELGNLNARDEWQPNNSSFVCFFLTSEVNEARTDSTWLTDL